MASQGRDKRPQTSPEPEDLPKTGIPPHSFPEYDPLMAPGFICSEFLERPYTLLGRKQMGNAGFEWARRANSHDFENQRLMAQVPSEKEASLEEEMAKLKEDLAKSQRINSLILTEKRKLNEDYLGLHNKYENVSAECRKLKDESSGFDCQITQLSGIRDAALAEASCAREEVKELQEEVQALKDAATRHPKEIWAAV
ncbi:hypothetical protein LIER_19182 [Lithospermum erythrorhizon]|uniref:Uncharacterized protein n=1 Tax=Lithospermum erythrorhizon TaxID=34254 RepID=A0AAV3QIB8_LITER